MGEGGQGNIQGTRYLCVREEKITGVGVGGALNVAPGISSQSDSPGKEEKLAAKGKYAMQNRPPILDKKVGEIWKNYGARGRWVPRCATRSSPSGGGEGTRPDGPGTSACYAIRIGECLRYFVQSTPGHQGRERRDGWELGEGQPKTVSRDINSCAAQPGVWGRFPSAMVVRRCLHGPDFELRGRVSCGIVRERKLRMHSPMNPTIQCTNSCRHSKHPDS